ncbi:MAG: hypothetical protein WBD02_10655 [Acidimicrobiia bacterium]
MHRNASGITRTRAVQIACCITAFTVVQFPMAAGADSGGNGGHGGGHGRGHSSHSDESPQATETSDDVSEPSDTETSSSAARPQRTKPQQHRDNLGKRERGAALKTAATALGMKNSELRKALAGKTNTLATVAAAHGVDVSVVISAIVADAKSRLDTAVAKGTLTQAKADALLVDATARITAFVNEGIPRPHKGPAKTPRTKTSEKPAA